MGPLVSLCFRPKRKTNAQSARSAPFNCQNFNCLAIASCTFITSAGAPFAISFDRISHALHIGSIVVASAEYELSWSANSCGLYVKVIIYGTVKEYFRESTRQHHTCRPGVAPSDRTGRGLVTAHKFTG